MTQIPPGFVARKMYDGATAAAPLPNESPAYEKNPKP